MRSIHSYHRNYQRWPLAGMNPEKKAVLYCVFAAQGSLPAQTMQPHGQRFGHQPAEVSVQMEVALLCHTCKDDRNSARCQALPPPRIPKRGAGPASLWARLRVHCGIRSLQGPGISSARREIGLQALQCRGLTGWPFLLNDFTAVYIPS